MRFLATILVIALSLHSCNFLVGHLVQEDELIGTWNIEEQSVEFKTLDNEYLEVLLMNRYGYNNTTKEGKLEQLSNTYIGNISGNLIFESNNSYVSTLNLDLLWPSGNWEFGIENQLFFDGDSLYTITDIMRLNNETLELRFEAQDLRIDLDDDGVKETTVIYFIFLKFYI